MLQSPCTSISSVTSRSTSLNPLSKTSGVTCPHHSCPVGLGLVSILPSAVKLMCFFVCLFVFLDFILLFLLAVAGVFLFLCYLSHSILLALLPFPIFLFLYSTNKEPVRCWESTGNRMCSFPSRSSHAGAQAEKPCGIIRVTEAGTRHIGSQMQEPLISFWDPGSPSWRGGYLG